MNTTDIINESINETISDITEATNQTILSNNYTEKAVGFVGGVLNRIWELADRGISKEFLLAFFLLFVFLALVIILIKVIFGK